MIQSFPGDEVAHYGCELPAHYGFWKALTGRDASVNRLWEASGGLTPGVFPLLVVRRRADRRCNGTNVPRGARLGATVGDRVRVQPASVHAQARFGTIEAVLSQSRYQVRWDDRRWSIISATDGSLSVVSRSKPAARRRGAAISPAKG